MRFGGHHGIPRVTCDEWWALGASVYDMMSAFCGRAIVVNAPKMRTSAYRMYFRLSDLPAHTAMGLFFTVRPSVHLCTRSPIYVRDGDLHFCSASASCNDLSFPP